MPKQIKLLNVQILNIKALERNIGLYLKNMKWQGLSTQNTN